MQDQLPAGIACKGTEFFISPFGASCLHDSQLFHGVTNIPGAQKAIVVRELMRRPVAAIGIKEMAGECPNAQMEQAIHCLFGKFDGVADVDANGKVSCEYVSCEKRGTCKWEGKVCGGLKLENGNMLSPSELKTLSLIQFRDQEIADLLYRSVETVKVHFKNIRNKTGHANNKALAVWATRKGIIA